MASSSRETTSMIILVIVAVALVVVLMAWVLGGFGGGGMMGGGSAGGVNGVMLIAVFVVLGVGGLAYLLLVPGMVQPVIPPPYPHPEWGNPPPEMTSLQILDARYARGEISRDDYLRMRQDLESRKP